MTDIAERIKKLREERGLKKYEVASAIGVMPNTYAGYESGRTRLPLDCLRELCLFYKVSADYILGLDGDTISVHRGTGAANLLTDYNALSPNDKERLEERAAAMKEYAGSAKNGIQVNGRKK